MSLEIIFIFLGSFVLVYILSFEYYAYRLGVITAHSQAVMVDAIIAEIRLTAPFAKKIVDPGCGNGALARKIACNFPEAEVIGLELYPVPFLRGWIKQRLFGPRNVHILKQDFFTFDYADADVIVVFIPENVLYRLAPILRKGLKPGALILSNAHVMPDDWTPYKSDMIQPMLKARLWCYRV